MSISDKRWEQRFNNYQKALARLEEAVLKVRDEFQIDADGSIEEDEFLDDIIKEGIIQRFEYTHELAWNVLKDFLKNAGNTRIFGSKDATRAAYAEGLIVQGEVWMDMIQSRNTSSHTYDETTADAIFLKIIHQYYTAFVQLRDTMQALQQKGSDI